MRGSSLTHGFGARPRNGLEAARSPDAILMALSLPGIDGWAATRLLPADAATRHISVVAITGQAHAHAADRARLTGGNRRLSRTAVPDHVIAEVRTAWRRHPSFQPSIADENT